MEFLLSDVHWRLLFDARFHLLPCNPKDGKEGVGRNRTSTFLLGDYEGRTACRNPASFAVALY
jgi:hypothetical protein